MAGSTLAMLFLAMDLYSKARKDEGSLPSLMIWSDGFHPMQTIALFATFLKAKKTGHGYKCMW